ncbi:MAG: oligosaccharide flippase family protein [Gaiellaceae bacterium]
MTVRLPEQFRRNTLANYTTAAVSLVLALTITPILARGLGKEAYGVWASVTTSVLYLDLLQLSSDLATVKYVARERALGDMARLRRTVATSFFALCVPAGAVLSLIPALVFLIPWIFHVHANLRLAAMVLIVCSGVDLAVGIAADTFGATIIAFQRYDLLNLTLVVTAVGQATAWTLILLLGGGLIEIGIATLTLSLASQFVRYLIVRRLVGGHSLRRRDFDRSLVRPILGMSAWMTVTDISALIISRLDVVIVAGLVGLPQAGIYAVATKLAAFVPRFTDPAVSVFFPHASGLAAAGDREGLRHNLLIGTRIAVAVAMPLTILLVVLAHPVLTAWVGADWTSGANVVACLAAASLVASLTKSGIDILRGMGDVKLPALIAVGEAALNLGLSIGLALTIGMVGVALGTLIAALVTSVFRVLYIAARLSTTLRSLLRAIGIGSLIAGGAAMGVGGVFNRVGVTGAGVGGKLHLLVAGAAIVGVYGSLMLTVGLPAGERRQLRRAVSRSLRAVARR